MENQEIPEVIPTCIAESFGIDDSDNAYQNRLTDEDIEKYFSPKKTQIIDPGNLPFKQEENHTSLDKKFPMCISKVLEFYE